MRSATPSSPVPTPQAGGDYSYLRRAFGRRTAFLYAWARLAVVQTGSIALLAFVVGDYLAQLVDLGPWSAPAFAAAAVVALTAVNWLGVRQGTRTQNWLTVVEIGGLLLVVAACLLLASSAASLPIAGTGADGSAYGLILVFVLLTYGGWNEAVYVTAEVRDAPRLIPRILTGSLALVAVLYLLVNVAYLRVLGLGGIAGADAVAADAMLVQGALALLLVAGGALARDGFRTAVEYTAPVFWLFFLLVGVALFVLRRRDPGTPRPFRVPLYPLLPLVFCATSAYLLYSSLAYTGTGALVGVGVLGVGALLLLRLDPSTPTKEPLP